MTLLPRLLCLHSIKTDILQYHYCVTNLSKRWPQSLIFKRHFKPPPTVLDTEAKMKRKDNVPILHELIYQTESSKWIKVMVFVSNLMTLAAPLTSLLIYCERKGMFNIPTQTLLDLMADAMPFLPMNEVYCVAVLICVANFVFNTFCTLYPLRIYYDAPSYTYTAVFMNRIFPWKIKKHQFTTIRSSYYSVLLDNKRAKVRIEYFKKPHDYYKFCP